MQKQILKALFFLCLFCSCKVHKNIQRSAAKSDSSVVIKADSVRVVKSGSSTSSTRNSTETKVEHKDNTVITITEETPVKDSAGRTTTHKRTTTIRKDRGTVETKTSRSLRDTSTVAKSDSVASKGTVATNVKKDEQKKDVQIKRTQGGTWVTLALTGFGLLIVIAGSYYVYKRYLKGHYPL